MDKQVKKINILFVDDEKKILLPLKAMFKREYNVFTATNGPAALNIVRNQAIHIIVSDQRMPEMMGVDLLRIIKKVSPHTVRILLTGYSDLNAAINSINEGAVFRFVEKPWDNAQLRETVKLASEMADFNARAYNAFTDSPLMASEKRGENLLIVDNNREVYDEIRRLFEKTHELFFASSVNGAVEILNHKDVAVLIIEAVVDNTSTVELIHVLKKQHPALVTLVLATNADTDMVVRLINQGQVFRYLPKPVRSGQLKLSILSAIECYNEQKQQPTELQQAQLLVETPDDAVTRGVVAKLTRSLKSLWSRVVTS